MYVNKQGNHDIMNQIEGFDLFNSEFLLKLDLLECEEKVIKKNEGRLDLLTSDEYLDHENYGSLGIKNRLTSRDQLKLEVKIKVPTRSQLNELLIGD